MKWFYLTFTSLLIIILSFISCEKIFWTDKKIVRVNHYRQTCVGVGPRLCYLVQEEDNIGMNDWDFSYTGFRGFTYQWGYVYDLKIKRRERISTPADASKYIYKLIEVTDKQKADPDEEFEINIVNHMDQYVYGNTNEGFTLFGEIEIDCGILCPDLSIMLDTAESLIVVFKHKDAETILLVDLIND